MRNMIIAAVIAVCLPFLPFWIWDGPSDMLMAMAMFYVVAMFVLTATEKKQP